ncbi:gamma tubulin complex Spc97/GCP2 subunit Alp4 [Exophiala xenobiotica]|uniref:Spindle pole body component n=1 Tax=Lithohypha guttulata TaxID=1690604 RepID=A0ABR0KFS3_9EURO|nr:gamma tubulin complex Spc97/GCP2 subunit Alp4 [Lithohypha guttulata]KAK5316934.1 gamma tubulin complex Spc97/GCP2 subunit Alp4 [Exophiala xenobiotica]
MNSAHYRTTSATDRRTSHANGLPSRVGSTRVRDYERPSVHENGSPVLPDGFDQEDEPKSAKQVLGGTERRKERHTAITTETIRSRRSPVKDTFDGGGRLRQKSILQSPPLKRKTQPDPPPDTKPWAPEAKLIPHSSAPLAVRITTPALRRDAPDTLDGPQLGHMSMVEEEEALLDDLLFVFMGFEGQYIAFVDAYNPAEEKDRLLGPSYRISPGLDPSIRDLVESMLIMASHYSALEAFVEIQSREEYGSVNHALCAAIRRLLKDYLILLAQLESKVTGESSFTLHQMHLSIIPTAQSLAQLHAVAQELLKKNSLLEEDVDETMDDFDADDIIERLKEGGDLLPGSMTKKRCIGGNVLALLTQRLSTYSGDPAARSILEMLLREASKPYMTMLNEWLHHGGIKDPHDEFLIGEKKSIKREKLDEDYTDEYWEKRYFIREKEIPPQLQSVKEKVLLAGKYLNVVRECGGVNTTSTFSHTPTSFEDPRFLDNVNHAYSFANQELLSLMLSKHSLRGRLRSIKHYFFLDRAEFFLYFLELSASELRKPQRSVNTGKLQSLLDLVLYQPGSIAVSDPYKEDVRIKMNDLALVPWLMKVVNVQGLEADNPESLAEQYKGQASATYSAEDKDISGYEALELDYNVPFPLSLIISRKTIIRYQLILRYTLSLRHVETTLIESWSEHNKATSWIHKSSNPRIEVWKRRAWNLRARMLVFVQQMLFYATAEVLEPQWQKLMLKVDQLESVDSRPSTGDKAAREGIIAESSFRQGQQTVDALMQEHLDMLDSSMKDLGLTQSKLLRIHDKMTASCTMFASYTSNLTRNLYSADGDFSHIHTDPTSAQSQKDLSNFRQFSNAGRDAVPPAPDQSRMDRIEETLTRHEEYFNRHLRVLIDTLNYYAATETVTLLGLCARLMNAEVQRRDDSALG